MSLYGIYLEFVMPFLVYSANFFRIATQGGARPAAPSRAAHWLAVHSRTDVPGETANRPRGGGMSSHLLNDSSLSVHVLLDVTLRGPEVCVAGQDLYVSERTADCRYSLGGSRDESPAPAMA